MKLTALHKELVITMIENATRDVKLFYLQPAHHNAIVYKAGQYLTFVDVYQEKEIRRSYSLASSPALNEPLVIGIKRISNGYFSRKMFDKALIGDKLYTQGAAGLFTLPENIIAYETIIFFAAGSGIVPVFSLLKTCLYSLNIKVVLIYSNHSKEDAVFYDQLINLQQQFSQTLTIEFLFSNAKNLSKARLHASLIEDYLKQFNVNANTLFYLCGPASYMRLCTYTLQRNGINPSQIKKEIFNTSVKVVKTIPPDINQHLVKLIFNNRHYTLQVQYPATILRAAKKQNVNLPYSCEAGKCGNCVAICKSGKVWMYHNEVLNENDIKKGFILTCTAFPLTDDVVVTL